MEEPLIARPRVCSTAATQRAPAWGIPASTGAVRAAARPRRPAAARTSDSTLLERTGVRVGYGPHRCSSSGARPPAASTCAANCAPSAGGSASTRRETRPSGAAGSSPSRPARQPTAAPAASSTSSACARARARARAAEPPRRQGQPRAPHQAAQAPSSMLQARPGPRRPPASLPAHSAHTAGFHLLNMNRVPCQLQTGLPHGRLPTGASPAPTGSRQACARAPPASRAARRRAWPPRRTARVAGRARPARPRARRPRRRRRPPATRPPPRGAPGAQAVPARARRPAAAAPPRPPRPARSPRAAPAAAPAALQNVPAPSANARGLHGCWRAPRHTRLARSSNCPSPARRTAAAALCPCGQARCGATVPAA